MQRANGTVFDDSGYLYVADGLANAILRFDPETATMCSKIEPMKKVARRLRKHRPLLLNWFRDKGQSSSGIVEGFNDKAKLSTRKAHGFKTYHAAEYALYHALEALPVPETTDEFF